MKKDIIIALLQQGKKYNEICEEAGCSKATISYHARKLGLEKSKKNTYNWGEIQNYYNEEKSLDECIAYFGFSRGAWHKAKKRGSIVVRRNAMPIEELLVTGRNTARTHLKNRLIKEGLLDYKCLNCGLSKWLDKPLSLQLEHKNGIHNDNRLFNLCLLCPNCHSQTETFAGKNKKYKNVGE